MADYKIDFSEIGWENPGPDVRFKAVTADGRRIRVIEFDKGFADQVWCDKSHFGYVLDGRMEMDFGDQKVQLQSGDGIIIPPGSPHKHRARVLSDKAHVVMLEER